MLTITEDFFELIDDEQKIGIFRSRLFTQGFGQP
jgi:hypothetical protein